MALGFCCTENCGWQETYEVDAGARVCPECENEIVGLTKEMIGRWAGIDTSEVEEVDGRAYATAIRDGEAEVRYAW